MITLYIILYNAVFSPCSSRKSLAGGGVGFHGIDSEVSCRKLANAEAEPVR